MPTPSDRRQNSIAEVISTRTCPPELDRLSDWRDSPEPTISPGEIVDDPLTPASALAPALGRSEDGSALLASDPLRVESKISGTPDAETAARERSSSPWDRGAGSQSPVIPSNSSLLRYEFSNVRVSCAAPVLLYDLACAGNTLI